MELSMDLWHLNNLKDALTLWTLNHVDCIPFSCIDPFRIVHNCANLIKKILILSLRKTSNLSWFHCCISLYRLTFELRCVWFCAFTKCTKKIYSKATIQVNKLILTPFSPFDIKCEILNLTWKASGNVFLGI